MDTPSRSAFLRAVCVSAALVSAGAACGAATTSATTTTTPEATIAIPGGSALAEVDVTLEHPGSETPSLLRLHPAAGQRAHLRLAMDSRIGLANGDAGVVSAPAPTIVFELDTVITAIAADGTFRVQQTIESFTVDETLGGEQAEAVRASLSGLEGVSTWSILDDRGRARAVGLDHAEDVPERLRQTLDSLMQAAVQAMPPLPLEPVGVGAQWSVADTMHVRGAALARHTRYELVERTSDSFTLVIQVNAEANHQTVALDGGMTGEIESMRTQGRGRIDLFDSAAVRRSEASSSTEMTMVVPSGNGPARVRMNYDIAIRIQPH